jgi:beta-lactamase regulating signal transducer with metallopeptidase domain/HEAT repeat protein
MMMMSTLITTLTQPALVAWLLKATALLVLALGVTTVLRRASAGTRHLVWLATLAGILALPALSLWAPLRLAIVPMDLVPSLPQVSAPERAIVQPVPATTTAPSATASQRGIASSQLPTTDHRQPSTATPNGRPFPIWAALLAVWGAVAVVLLAWLGFGALSVRRIVRAGRELDERAWTAPLCEIADRLDLDEVPRLLSSPLVEMPFACGVVQPTIVLPASAEEWSDSRRRAVLFHELAHVKRRDLLGHTLGRVACALYWFHPLVWTAGRRLRAESERACDDLVLSCGARASDYADHLLDIVISVRHHGAPATAMPMARRRELEGRVLAILDPAVARIGPGRLQSAALVAGIGVLALSVAAMAPARRATRDIPRVAMRATPESSTVTRLVTRQHNETKTIELTRMAPAPAARDGYPTPTPFPQPTPKPFFAAKAAASTAPAGSGAGSLLSDAVGAITNVAVRSAAAAISGIVNGQGKQGVDSAKVALLLKVLRSDPDANVRRMAAWGLAEAGNTLGAVDVLAETLRSDEDDNVREMAAWALAESPRRESAHRALNAALRRDPSENVRESAAWALANDLRDDDRAVLEEALASDANENVRETAAWALGNSPQRPASRALVTALGDRSPNVRESAAWALAEIEDEDAGPAVEAAFKRETNANVRMAELRALTFMHVDDRSILDAALESKDAELRARAVRMLAGSSDSWPEPRPRPRPRPMP